MKISNILQSLILLKIKQEIQSIIFFQFRINLASFYKTSFVFIFLLGANCENSQDWKTGKLIPMKEYSEDDPREWQEIAPEHIPQARISWNNGKEAILIETPELKSTYNHYIEKYGILDLEGKEIASTIVERTNAPFNFGYVELESLQDLKKVKLFAKCNLHDLWVNTITIESLNEEH